MKMHYCSRVLLSIFCLLSLARPVFAIDFQKIKTELGTTGTEGWIHGAVKEKGLFVFTSRNPKDFFDYLELSLVTKDSAMRVQLASFKRHDKVRIKGTILPNPSPQNHVLVTSIELVKEYEPPYKVDAYQYDSEIPKELLSKRKATFLVHAVAEEGHILVLDYKGQVVPMFVVENSVVKNLSRNDIIRIRYKVQSSPRRPVHLELDEKAKKPVKILETIKDINGKPASVEGMLVLFPKSPEITVNVFAVLQKSKSGTNRQYTIVNFENPDVFKQTREKLQQAWDKHPGAYTNGRNKLVSSKLRVNVKGTFNQVSANQANPQILINSPDDIRITEL